MDIQLFLPPGESEAPVCLQPVRGLLCCAGDRALALPQVSAELSSLLLPILSTVSVFETLQRPEQLYIFFIVLSISQD